MSLYSPAYAGSSAADNRDHTQSAGNPAQWQEGRIVSGNGNQYAPPNPVRTPRLRGQSMIVEVPISTPVRVESAGNQAPNQSPNLMEISPLASGTLANFSQRSPARDLLCEEVNQLRNELQASSQIYRQHCEALLSRQNDGFERAAEEFEFLARDKMQAEVAQAEVKHP